MKKEFIHLILIPFTGLGLHGGYRGDEWFKYRIGLFKQYTLKSFLNQINKDFIVWLAFREVERTNPLCQELHRYLKTIPGFKFVFTYGGIPYWDDKYPNDKLLERLEKILPQLKEAIGNKKYVYETVIGSDDMYHREAVATIQKEKFGYKKVLVHNKGYVFSHKTKKLGTWEPSFPKECPPLNTFMFPVEIFLNAKKFYNYIGPYKDHHQVTKIFKWKQLPDFRYCVLVHEWNISSHWRTIEMRNWKSLLQMLLSPYNWKRLFLRILGKLQWRSIVKKHDFIKTEFNNKETKKLIMRNFGIEI